jgi:ankyrin repeat protein
MDKVFNLV